MGKRRNNANKQKGNNLPRQDKSYNNEEVIEPQLYNINKQHNKGESRTDTPKWYLIISVTLSLVALLVSFGSLYFMQKQTDILFKQTDIFFRQTDIQNNNQALVLQENQPIFRVEYSFDEYDEDKATTEIISVENIGREAKKISIQNQIFLQILYSRLLTHITSNKEESKSVDYKLFYLPIICYFSEFPDINSLKGDIVDEYYEDNYKNYRKLMKECDKQCNDTVCYQISLLKFLIIDYVDIYDTSHCLYYFNGNLANKEIFKSYLDQSKSYLCIDDGNFEKIKKFVEENIEKEQNDTK